jgi:hypothetical protein
MEDHMVTKANQSVVAVRVARGRETELATAGGGGSLEGSAAMDRIRIVTAFEEAQAAPGDHLSSG